MDARGIGWLGCLLLVMTVVASAAPAPRRVLIIHSFGREFAPFTAISSTFRTELARQSPEPIEFHEAALEGALVVEGDREEPVVEYLRVLFDGRRLDVVAVFGNPAVQFWLRHRDRHFPGVPTLIGAVEERHLLGKDLGTNSAAVTFSLNLAGAVEHVRQVLPGTTHIAVVLGVAPVERFWAAQAKLQFQAFTNRITFTWLNEFSFDEIQQRTSRLPPHTAILYGGLLLDADGVPYEQDRPLAALTSSANAPIFGFFDHLLGKGIVGGPLLPIHEIGRETARVAARILSGEAPGGLRTPTFGPSSPVYDWRELKRFGIRRSALPPGSTIRFEEPTLWERYRWPIIVVSSVCVLEGGLIVALVAQLKRRRKVEATLRDSEQRLSLATSAAKVGVWSWDVRTGAIEATPECKRIFGWKAEQTVDIGMFESRVHPEDRVAIREALSQAIEKRTVYDKEYRIVWPGQTAKWISARGCCRYEDGGATAMMGVLIDITESRVAEHQAAQHRAELAHLTRVNTLSELSGSLAHELNQPLGIILSNAQAARHLLAQSPPDIAEVQDILADIVAADRRAGDLIQRLRALLKRGEITFQPVAMNEVMDEVLYLAKADMIDRGVVVVRELSGDLPRVQGDRVQLQQLLLNLVINAADAMAGNAPGTRRMGLVSAPRDGAVRVSVRDEGVGLPEDPECLFKPFFTTKEHGLGMGLAICRSIAQAHRGKLWAESHPERGAVFHLEIPIDPR